MNERERRDMLLSVRLQARTLVRHGITAAFPDLRLPPPSWESNRITGDHDCSKQANPYTGRCRDGRRTW